MRYRLCVGEKIPELATQKTDTTLECLDGTWAYIVAIPNIQTDDVQDLVGNDLEFAFCEVSDCIMFLAKLGQIGWTEAPYEPRMSSSSPDMNTRFLSGFGMALLFIFADASNGEIVAMRQIGLDTDFSNHFYDLCRDIYAMGDLDKEQYMRRLEEVRQQYPITEDFLEKVLPGNFYTFEPRNG